MLDLINPQTQPALETFLTYWYGPSDQPAQVVPLPGWMPRSLRTWFATTGRWAKLVMTQNQVLSGDHPEVEDGKLVVWVENQGVWEWGVDPDSDDPEVYDRENEDDEPWQPCTCRERHLGRSGGLFDVRPDLGRTDGRLSRSSP